MIYVNRFPMLRVYPDPGATHVAMRDVRAVRSDLDLRCITNTSQSPASLLAAGLIHHPTPQRDPGPESVIRYEDQKNPEERSENISHERQVCL